MNLLLWYYEFHACVLCAATEILFLCCRFVHLFLFQVEEKGSF